MALSTLTQELGCPTNLGMGLIIEGEFDFCSDIILTPVCYSDSLIKSTLF